MTLAFCAANVPHIQEEQDISVEECKHIATKKKFKTPSESIVDIKHNKLNYIREKEESCICLGTKLSVLSKKRIGEEVVDQIQHTI